MDSEFFYELVCDVFNYPKDKMFSVFQMLSMEADNTARLQTKVKIYEQIIEYFLDKEKKNENKS